MHARRRFIAGTAAAALAAAGARALFAAPAERVIRVTAHRFLFEPNELTLTKGVPVAIELTSTDVMMGFSVPDFDVRSDIVPGQVTRLRFTPDKTGNFVFLCDVFCGSGHSGMSGVMRVIA